MKTKYGWLATIILVIMTAILWWWFDSDRNSTADELAMQELVSGDRLMRGLERSNQMVAKELAQEMAGFVRPTYLSMLDYRGAIVKAAQVKLPLLSATGQKPLFVAVLGENDVVIYLNVMGKEHPEVQDAVLGHVLEPLMKSAKGNTLPEATTPEKVEVSYLLPGESAGKYVYVPKEDKNLSKNGRHVYRLNVYDVAVQKSTGKKTLLKAGSVVVGYASPLDDKGKYQVMNFAREKAIRSNLVFHEQQRRTLFDTLTALYKQGIKGLPTKFMDKPPYILMVLNPKGYVIVRDKDISKIVGFNFTRAYPQKMAILSGALRSRRPLFDIWEFEVINRLQRKSGRSQGLYQAVAVPLMDDEGHVRGVFASAWDFSIRAMQASSMSRVDTAFFYNKKLYFTSFKQGENAKEKALNAFLEGRLTDVGISPLTIGKKTLPAKRVNLAGDDYMIAFYKFGRSFEGGDKYGYVVLVNVSRIASPASLGDLVFLLLFVLALFLIALVDYMVYAFVSRAIDEVEQGVQHLADGDLCYVIEPTHGETVSLADSINELMDILLDRPMEDEETGERPPREGIHRVVLGPMPGMPYRETDDAVARYINMDEDMYSADLYQRFRDAWEQLGVEDVPERLEFEQRVALFERLVMRRFECDRVYFDVKAGNGEVQLVPLPVQMM